VDVTHIDYHDVDTSVPLTDIEREATEKSMRRWKHTNAIRRIAGSVLNIESLLRASVPSFTDTQYETLLRAESGPYMAGSTKALDDEDNQIKITTR
jgi:hypothetical protein